MDAKDIGKKVENPVLIEAMKRLRENENSDTLRAFFRRSSTFSIYITGTV